MSGPLHPGPLTPLRGTKKAIALEMNAILIDMNSIPVRMNAPAVEVKALLGLWHRERCGPPPSGVSFRSDFTYLKSGRSFDCAR
jgi:hypothetical protein